MHPFYFEAKKPLFLKADLKDILGQAKIFIHVYPSGYVVLQVALAFSPKTPLAVGDVQEIVRATRPWQGESSIRWTSRIGNGPLRTIIDSAERSIAKSILSSRQDFWRKGDWHSVFKLVLPFPIHSVNSINKRNLSICRVDKDVLGNIGRSVVTEFLTPRGKYQELEIPGSYWFRWLVASRQGVACAFIPCWTDQYEYDGQKWTWRTGPTFPYRRKRALCLFWRVVSLTELIQLKMQVNIDYCNCLRSWITTIRESYLAETQQTQKYQPEIARYLGALDNHTRSYQVPFYRRIYSALSRGIGFESMRRKTLRLVELWQREITRVNYSSTTESRSTSNRMENRPSRIRMYPEDIDDFHLIKEIGAKDVSRFLNHGCMDVYEESVQLAFESILAVPFHKRDWGGETNDLYTANVTLSGVRTATAFLLKGRGLRNKSLEIADCGKNGDQILRLFQSSAELFIVQFVGIISEAVIADVEGKVRQRRASGLPAWYCIIDGQDTARILLAYGFIGSLDQGLVHARRTIRLLFGDKPGAKR